MTNAFNVKVGQALPEDHSVVRFCPPKHIERDPDTEEIVGIFPEAWKLRENEDSLSVNWLEFFDDEGLSQLNHCIAQFKTNLKINKRSAFAVCQVAVFKNICSSRSNIVKIVYSPEDGNLSHSSIKRIKSDDHELLAEISYKAVKLIFDNNDSQIAPLFR